jgi:hypothetical protein
MVALLAWHKKPLVGKIPDAGHEAKAQQMTERKGVIRSNAQAMATTSATRFVWASFGDIRRNRAFNKRLFSTICG